RRDDPAKCEQGGARLAPRGANPRHAGSPRRCTQPRARPRRNEVNGRPDDHEARPMIRVLIAEDQSMVLGALAALLEIENDIQVVGQARDGREALELVERERPDVLLTDIEMPELTG